MQLVIRKVVRIRMCLSILSLYQTSKGNAEVLGRVLNKKTPLTQISGALKEGKPLTTIIVNVS